MIREVLINGQQVDVDQNSIVGYILDSPVFRDISNIFVNRTTTYKIPITNRNAAIFKLYEHPDIITDFARQWHDFEEWRDGFLFFKGKGRVLEAKNGYYEMGVIWGNGLNLRSIKDRKLRDLNIVDYVWWNKSTQYMQADSKKGVGFLKVDFGQGVSDISKSRPCVNIRKILDYIKQSEKVDFRYPERFEQLFNTTWIPLLDNNLSSVAWDIDYTTYTKVTGSVYYFQGSTSQNKTLWIYLYVEGGATNIIEDVHPAGYGGSFSYIKNNENPIHIRSQRPFYIKVDTATPKAVNWKLRFKVGSDYQDFPLIQDGDTYKAYCDIDLVAESNNKTTYPVFELVDGANDRMNVDILKLPIDDMKLNIQVQKREASFGDPLPIAANMPDMRIVDFIKVIMNMFGLFTYYRNNQRETDIDIVYFISIDDIYNNLPKAYDWTHKVINNGNRISIKRKYSEYAQRNYMRYKNDKEIKEATDAFIEINDKTLTENKDLFTLPFSASNNIEDRNGNTYASIPLLEEDGKVNKLTPRILTDGRYSVDNTKEDLKSVYFPQDFKFGGQAGLTASYYSQYQYILRNPVSLECNVYFSSAELATLNEELPVFIDGVHYMPTSWNIYVDGSAACKLLRMPPKL